MPGFNYRGAINSSTPVTGVIYVPLRNLPLLFYYAEEASQPGSPLYGHYLSKQEAAALFYPSSQFESVLSVLKSHGLRVLFTAADSIIVFEGPAGSVERLLGATIGLYSNGSTAYYQLTGPASLDGYPVYVSNVTGLLLRRPPFLVTASELEALASKVYGLQAISEPMEAYNLTELPGAYNATALYSMGYKGSGVTVGVLDFYGDPYVYQSLETFDRLYGLQSPPNFTVVPIGPYNPNLGVYTGWNYEIELDVEAVHAMAPGASIVLFVASGALPLSAAIAYIDQYYNVSIVTQSFGLPESLLSNLGFNAYLFNVYLSDMYYALGESEGITFLAASGDGGGMGYGTGPLGAVNYPASSPFVLSVGGTAVYMDFGQGGPSSYYQTAWSSMGFVPYLINLGGSTGGYSAWEPMPWYQQGVVPRPPEGFTLGRAVPDVAASASIMPGVYIVGAGNQTIIAGGTSEASPLTAGLLALVEQYVGHRLGLLNPTLYELYRLGLTKAFENITFGYNIPWVVKPGYNLVTGLGALNAGMLAYYLRTPPGQLKLTTGLSVEIYVNGSQSFMGYTLFDLTPGKVINVSALVEYPNGSAVTSGHVELKLVSPQGVVLEELMHYNSTTGLWAATFSVPGTGAGNSLIEVNASSGSYEGVGAMEVYLGYFASFEYPLADEPWDSAVGIPVAYMITTLNGNPAPHNLTYEFELLQYRPLSNSYETVFCKSLQGGFTGQLVSNVSAEGYYIIEIRGPAAGYVPFINGIGLQSVYVLPQVLASPGEVQQGGYMIIYGLPMPPLESYSLGSQQLGTPLSTAIEYGSNITAYLVLPSGRVVSEAYVPLSPAGYYLGELYVPPNISPGLYYVILSASYNSSSIGLLLGEGEGMIYVSPPARASIEAVPRYPAEGQPVTVYLNVTLNGRPVTYGAFSLTVLPSSAQYLYGYATYYVEIPLYYNTTLGLWVGTAQLPSPFSSGEAQAYDGLYVGQPWTIAASGVGAVGGPVANVSTQVMQTRYIYYAHQNLTEGDFYPYLALLYDDNITFNGLISDSAFVGVNYIVNSNLTLQDSQVQGLLVLVNSDVTLVSSRVHYITAYHSNVTIVASWVDSLELLDGSSVSYAGPQVSIFSGNQTSVLRELESLWKALRQVEGELAGNVSQLREEVSSLNATVNSEISQLRLLVSDYVHEEQSMALQLRNISSGEGAASGLLLNVTVRLDDLAQEVSQLRASEAQMASELTYVNSTLQGALSSSTTLRSYVVSLGSQLSQLEDEMSMLSSEQALLERGQRAIMGEAAFSAWLAMAAVLAMSTVLAASSLLLRRLRGRIGH